MGAQGWNVDDVSPGDRHPLVRLLREEGTCGVGTRVTCTLLGPEGSASGMRAEARGLGVEPSDSRSLTGVAGGGGEYRPYVENYTVDASIFDSSRE